MIEAGQIDPHRSSEGAAPPGTPHPLQPEAPRGRLERGAAIGRGGPTLQVGEGGEQGIGHPVDAKGHDPIPMEEVDRELPVRTVDEEVGARSADPRYLRDHRPALRRLVRQFDDAVGRRGLTDADVLDHARRHDDVESRFPERQGSRIGKGEGSRPSMLVHPAAEAVQRQIDAERLASEPPPSHDRVAVAAAEVQDVSVFLGEFPAVVLDPLACGFPLEALGFPEQVLHAVSLSHAAASALDE
jgi:hypothetical protein